MFQPQRVAPQFDPSLVQKWMNACKSSHGIRCQIPAKIDVPGLLLINRYTNQVCEAPSNASYVALSYVWAKTTAVNVVPVASFESNPVKSLPLLHSMSQTITDSICVTKQLGFTYLWIDKYCIKQHDNAHKMAQIKMMDRIYKRAELTIIAAAGDDENEGLPGVRSTLRYPQTLFGHGLHTVIFVPPDISLCSKRSKWATRGWTFQEDILSSRRLCFGFYETFFVCHSMQCREALRGIERTKDDIEVQRYSQVSSSSGSHDNYKAISKFLERGGPFLGDDLKNLQNKPEAIARGYLQQVRHLLKDYTPRTLTCNSDALSAFSGVFSHFEDGQFPVYNIQGLPILFAKQSPMQLEEGLAIALCWDRPHWEESERRPDFPSWTWAGWTGPIDYHHGRLELFPTNVSLEYKEGSIVSLETVARHVADDIKSVAAWQSHSAT
ncbi:HET-domain-containing protein [Mollisia scopiformis]|uniref:HET-domain-containing protein n=1 Tax=Mollisia scopiformis TaxID=149040 RepID=A0A194X6T1_MOLSC|nr:HET-domain-containing protein [Mollisia scopiformis]KUJ15885.1 HET-domain-containing protein [Mollisia scopiformis]